MYSPEQKSPNEAELSEFRHNQTQHNETKFNFLIENKHQYERKVYVKQETHKQMIPQKLGVQSTDDEISLGLTESAFDISDLKIGSVRSNTTKTAAEFSSKNKSKSYTKSRFPKPSISLKNCSISTSQN